MPHCKKGSSFLHKLPNKEETAITGGLSQVSMYVSLTQRQSPNEKSVGAAADRGRTLWGESDTQIWSV